MEKALSEVETATQLFWLLKGLPSCGRLCVRRKLCCPLKREGMLQGAAASLRERKHGGRCSGGGTTTKGTCRSLGTYSATMELITTSIPQAPRGPPNRYGCWQPLAWRGKNGGDLL